MKASIVLSASLKKGASDNSFVRSISEEMLVSFSAVVDEKDTFAKNMEKMRRSIFIKGSSKTKKFSGKSNR